MKHVTNFHTSTTKTEHNVKMSDENREQVKHVVISGAGIVGLVLALALKKHVGIDAEIYEKASTFQHNVGAGMFRSTF